MARERMRKVVEARAHSAAEERVLIALVGEKAGEDTRQKFRKMLREGELDNREISLERVCPLWIFQGCLVPKWE